MHRTFHHKVCKGLYILSLLFCSCIFPCNLSYKSSGLILEMTCWPLEDLSKKVSSLEDRSIPSLSGLACAYKGHTAFPNRDHLGKPGLLVCWSRAAFVGGMPSIPLVLFANNSWRALCTSVCADVRWYRSMVNLSRIAKSSADTSRGPLERDRNVCVTSS